MGWASVPSEAATKTKQVLIEYGCELGKWRIGLVSLVAIIAQDGHSHQKQSAPVSVVTYVSRRENVWRKIDKRVSCAN